MNAMRTRTLLAIDQNSRPATITPTTFATFRGMTRLVRAARKRATRANSRPSTSSTANVIRAIAQTLSGCAVSTGAIFITARIEFCQPAVRHRKTMTTSKQTAATSAFAIDLARAEGSGNSR